MVDESNAIAQPARPPFSYVTSIDPALSTFGWKIVGLAHLAMVLPIVGAFLPRDAGTDWPGVFIVIGIVVVLGGMNLVWFLRMVSSDGYTSPPPLLVLAEVVCATVAAALLSYAIGGRTGIYRPLVFVPTLLVAMVGDRWMIAVTWLVATVSVTTAAVATGVIDQGVAAFVASYGVIWGIAAVMVHLLAVSALHSDHQVAGLAEVAGIAARANSLVEGAGSLLPVVARWAGAAAAGAYRIGAEGAGRSGATAGEPLHRWPADAHVAPPSVGELEEARAGRGVVLRGRRAVLVAGSDDDGVLAIVLEGIDQPAYDRLMVQFNLERMVGQVGVLVSRSRYIAQLENLGRTDGLTGLPNRRALADRLQAARIAARRRGEHLSVVMIDLDNFKIFNDSFGHLAGDDLLRGYAKGLRKRLRASDFAARYGGEEFCMILPDTDGAGAQQLFAELHEAFRNDEELSGVTFSAGVAVWDGVEDAEAVIGRADRALYAAKAAGRDRTVLDAP